MSNDSSPSQVIEIDATWGRYLLINISEIHQANNQKLAATKGCAFCIYSIPCETSVLFDNYAVDQRIVNCNNEDSSDTVSYPNNLALALHITSNISKFHLYDYLNKNQILEQNLNSFNRSMFNTLALMHNKTVDLKAISNIILRNNTEFMNKITKELEDFNNDLSASNNWLDFKAPTLHWAEISGLILLVVEMGHILFTIYLFRRISVLTSLLSILTVTRAQSSEHDHITTMHIHEIPTYMFYLAIITTILNFLVFAIWLTHKICKKRYSKTYLGISFASELTQCTVFLSTLPKEPLTKLRLNFDGGIVVEGIKCGLWPQLFMPNNRLQIFVLQNWGRDSTSIFTGDSLRLTWCEYLKLRKIIKQPFTAHFIAQQNHNITYVRPCPADCDHMFCNPWFSM